MNTEVKTLLRRLWGQKWLILTPAAVGLAIASSIAFFERDVFQAEATLLAEFHGQLGDSLRSSDRAKSKQLFSTVREHVYQLDFLDVLTNENTEYDDPNASENRALDLYPGTDDSEVKVKRAAENLRTQVNTRNGTIRVSFQYSEGDDPAQTAADTVNYVANYLINEARTNARAEQKVFDKFYDDQIDAQREHVQQVQTALLKFREGNKGALPQDREANMAMIRSAEQTLSMIGYQEGNLRLRIKDMEPALESARKKLYDARVLAGADPELEPRLRRLEDLRAQLTEFEQTFTPESKQIKTLKADIGRLQKQVEELEKKGAERADSNDPGVQFAQKELDALEARYGREKSHLDNISARIKKAQEQIQTAQERIERSRELEIQDFTKSRALDRAQLKLDNLLGQQEKLQLSIKFEDTEDYSLTIMQAARRMDQPIGPNRMRFSLIGLVLGLALGGGIAFLRVQTDQTVRSKDDIRKILPGSVVISIPDVHGAATRVSGVASQVIVATCLLVIVAGAVGVLGAREGWWGGVEAIESVIERAKIALGQVI